jgi:hypothetical protein
MSQLVLDEQVDLTVVLPPLKKWITVEPLAHLRPDEQILDDRVPTLLRALKQPTFVTIDQDFWHRRWCDPGYCILYFELRDKEQKLIPDLLRELFRHDEFKTRAARMGKVACVSPSGVRYWQFQVAKLQHLLPPPRRKR